MTRPPLLVLLAAVTTICAAFSAPLQSHAEVGGKNGGTAPKPRHDTGCVGYVCHNNIDENDDGRRHGSIWGCGNASWHCPVATPADRRADGRGGGGAGNPPPPPPARVVAAQALSGLRLPSPTIHHAPADPTWVGLDTWLWITGSQWRTVTSRASVRGVTVDAAARPTSVVWRMGERLPDGSQGATTCDGPGKVWPKGSTDESLRSDCTYAYSSSSAGRPRQRYPISATIVWTVTWTCSGPCDQGSAGSTRTTRSTGHLRVGERQTVVDG